MWEPGLPPSPGYDKASLPFPRVVPEAAKWEAETFIISQQNEHPTPASPVSVYDTRGTNKVVTLPQPATVVSPSGKP